MQRKLQCAVMAMLLAGLTGCATRNDRYMTPERMSRGLVVVLPGIEGAGLLSESVRSGLDDAGVHRGLVVFPWGRAVPVLGPLLNQMDFIGNRQAGARLAKLIKDYQDRYPGRPIHLVGHSGGGGVAVFAAEALPTDRQIKGIILLSPSISADYDLSEALARTSNGIVNFWSPADVGLLVFGTTIFGNVDGARGPAAGAVGFRNTESPALLLSRLHQVEWSQEMAESGHHGTHLDSAGRQFVRQHVAPWISANDWRAMHASAETRQIGRR